MRPAAIAALLVACFGVLCGATGAQADTTVHAVLDLEAEIYAAPAPRRQLLDDIISEARRTIRPPGATSSGASARAEAIRTLEAIDSLLVARNFIYPGDGLVQHLSQTLTPRQLSQTQYAVALNQHHNARRVRAMEANSGRRFYVADCDMASFMYLAIGEAIGLPIGFVEVPGHNFVRWQLADGTHINFETMDGVEQSDAYYRSAYGVNPAHIAPGRQMVTLTRDEILGYMQRLRGVWWKKRGEWSKARRDYLGASRLRPTDAAGHNGLAWLLATCPQASCRDGNLAVASAMAALRLERKADYVDTLACAYAAAGDFRTAERHSLEANAMSGNLYEENLTAIRGEAVCPADALDLDWETLDTRDRIMELLKPEELGNH